MTRGLNLSYQTFANSLVTIVGLGMPIPPLWILEMVSRDHARTRLGYITGFIVVFFLLMIMATTARVTHALATTTTYSALLIIFIQMGSGL
jgi:hypothetical protein